MDNQDELQELDLEAIMREFHDPSKDLPPEEPEAEESTEAAEEAPAEALADAGAEDVPAAPEVPEDETPVPDSMEELDIGQISPEEDAGEEAAADPTATVRIDDISDVHAEAAEDSAAGEEPAAEDGSENPEEPPAQPEYPRFPYLLPVCKSCGWQV